MATKNFLALVKFNHRFIIRTFCSGRILCNKPEDCIIQASPNPKTTVCEIPDVPGLSNDVVKNENVPVGPGASKSTDYKNPEYFNYNSLSYYQAEIELAGYRCPQPSSVHD